MINGLLVALPTYAILSVRVLTNKNKQNSVTNTIIKAPIPSILHYYCITLAVICRAKMVLHGATRR